MINLARPLYKRVKEIEESLFFKGHYETDGEVFIYGNREHEFDKYELDQLRQGNKPTVIKYLKDRLNELDNIRNGAINIELEAGGKFHALYNNIFQCKAYIQNELNNSVIVPKKYSTNITFVWLGLDKEIKELFNKILGVFIAKETQYEDFEILFKGVAVDNAKRIIWNSNNATELLYFVMKLRECELIDSFAKKINYTQIKDCFIKSNGDSFNERFKSLKTNITVKLKKERIALINDIVTSFQ